MKLLLDTHVVLWWLAGDGLSKVAITLERCGLLYRLWLLESRARLGDAFYLVNVQGDPVTTELFLDRYLSERREGS